MPAPYVRAKGFASVWIYVNRGASTELWDGKRPIAADRLRVKLGTYAATGRASIPPVWLLKSSLLMALYLVLSERMFGR